MHNFLVQLLLFVRVAGQAVKLSDHGRNSLSKTTFGKTMYKIKATYTETSDVKRGQIFDAEAEDEAKTTKPRPRTIF